MPVRYPRGTILYVRDVPDRQGGNNKDRHVVLINDMDAADTLFQGVAVTGTFSHPLPATSIKLPHRRGRANSKTGLDKESVADCTWIVTATPADILLRRGFTPATELTALLAQVQTFLAAQQQPSPPPPQPPPPPAPTGS